MKTRVLKEQWVYTLNVDGQRSTYKREVTVFDWDSGKQEAECNLHGGIADLVDTSSGWKVKRIVYA